VCIQCSYKLAITYNNTFTRNFTTEDKEELQKLKAKLEKAAKKKTTPEVTAEIPQKGNKKFCISFTKMNLENCSLVRKTARAFLITESHRSYTNISKCIRSLCFLLRAFSKLLIITFQFQQKIQNT